MDWNKPIAQYSARDALNVGIEYVWLRYILFPVVGGVAIIVVTLVGTWIAIQMNPPTQESCIAYNYATDQHGTGQEIPNWVPPAHCLTLPHRSTADLCPSGWVYDEAKKLCFQKQTNQSAWPLPQPGINQGPQPGINQVEINQAAKERLDKFYAQNRAYLCKNVDRKYCD